MIEPFSFNSSGLFYCGHKIAVKVLNYLFHRLNDIKYNHYSTIGQSRIFFFANINIIITV